LTPARVDGDHTFFTMVWFPFGGVTHPALDAPRPRVLSVCMGTLADIQPGPGPGPGMRDLPIGPPLVRAWNGTGWTERCPVWAYMVEGWTLVTAAHVWDGHRWADPP
jgi:hypothetical protein